MLFSKNELVLTGDAEGAVTGSVGASDGFFPAQFSTTVSAHLIKLSRSKRLQAARIGRLGAFQDTCSLEEKL